MTSISLHLFTQFRGISYGFATPSTTDQTQIHLYVSLGRATLTICKVWSDQSLYHPYETHLAMRFKTILTTKTLFLSLLTLGAFVLVVIITNHIPVLACLSKRSIFTHTCLSRDLYCHKWFVTLWKQSCGVSCFRRQSVFATIAQFVVTLPV